MASGPGAEKPISYIPRTNWYGTDRFVVQINDWNEHFDRTTIYVHVLPEPDYPIFTQPGQTLSVMENRPRDYTIGIIEVTDPDILFYDPNNRSLTYSILSGNIDEAFNIWPSTGMISVRNDAALDYEQYTKFSLEIAVANNSYTSVSTFDVLIKNLNDNPPQINNQTWNIDETTPNGSIIGTVTVNDPDEDTQSFSIVSGNSSFAFFIDNNGNIIVSDDRQLDYELGAKVFILTIMTSDGIFSDEGEIIINVQNVNDNAPLVNNQTFYISENSPGKAWIGTVVVNDDDPNDTFSFVIADGNINDAFLINNQTGMITVNGTGKLDYDNINQYALLIQVSDGVHVTNTIVSIFLNNHNENTFVANQTFYVDENKPDKTWVGTVVANTNNPADTIIYEIIQGNTDNAFRIDTQSGKLSVNGDNKL
ncbi:MAG: hypothetical protein OMM_09941, partial [Candidatus Magnetoglobus multicellularis str. Araruama]